VNSPLDYTCIFVGRVMVTAESVILFACCASFHFILIAVAVASCA